MLSLTNWLLLVNPRHTCTSRVTVLGLCVWCILFSYHALPIVQQDVLARSADYRESFKFGVFAVMEFFLFLSLGTLCLCVSVTKFPTRLFSGAWRRFKFGFFYKDTSFESYYAFSL